MHLISWLLSFLNISLISNGNVIKDETESPRRKILQLFSHVADNCKLLLWIIASYYCEFCLNLITTFYSFTAGNNVLPFQNRSHIILANPAAFVCLIIEVFQVTFVYLILSLKESILLGIIQKLSIKLQFV